MAAHEMKVTFVNQPNPNRIAQALALCWKITLEKRNPGMNYEVEVTLGDGTVGKSGHTLPDVCA